MSNIEKLGDSLRDFYGRVTLAMNRALVEEGMSVARIKLLILISHKGPLRSADIADTFGQSPRTVTEAIDALERDGLIRRDPDPADRRAKRISITAQGTVALNAAEPLRRDLAEAVFSVLDEDEKTTLTRILDKLNHRLEERTRLR